MRDSKPDIGDFRKLVCAGLRALDANSQVVGSLFALKHNAAARKRAKSKLKR